MVNLDDYKLIEEGIKIAPCAGAGMEFEADGTCYRIVAPGTPREVSLNVTTYLGSIGAVHYYGELRADGLGLLIVSGGDEYMKPGKIVGVLSESVDKARPRFSGCFYIDLHRQLSATEIAAGSRYGPDRWQYYEPGDWTNAFHSRAKVVVRAREVFRALFAPDWRLVSRM
jgi:hypothetical protein